jgi:hypothetical protein
MPDLFRLAVDWLWRQPKVVMRFRGWDAENGQVVLPHPTRQRRPHDRTPGHHRRLPGQRADRPSRAAGRRAAELAVHRARLRAASTARPGRRRARPTTHAPRSQALGARPSPELRTNRHRDFRAALTGSRKRSGTRSENVTPISCQNRQRTLIRCAGTKEQEERTTTPHPPRYFTRSTRRTRNQLQPQQPAGPTTTARGKGGRPEAQTSGLASPGRKT